MPARYAFLSIPATSTLLAVSIFYAAASSQCIAQTSIAADFPKAQFPHLEPCKSVRAGAGLITIAAAEAVFMQDGDMNPSAIQPTLPQSSAPCHSIPIIDWYSRIANGSEVKPLTPSEKARLAVKNILDPFNAITILGTSAISVGFDSDSAYGPGMAGWGKNVGVSYTQSITGEFFGTFLIPSLVHQDPHYHRMPNASIPRRFGHAIVQVVWTQGDNDRGMVNYANIVGFAIEDEIGNLYIPSRETNAEASARRYGLNMATAPLDNFISEFLPDVAKHIHVQVVIFQKIIDRVANSGTNQ